jgi:hypothetical protein
MVTASLRVDLAELLTEDPVHGPFGIEKGIVIKK